MTTYMSIRCYYFYSYKSTLQLLNSNVYPNYYFFSVRKLDYNIENIFHQKDLWEYQFSFYCPHLFAVMPYLINLSLCHVWEIKLLEVLQECRLSLQILPFLFIQTTTQKYRYEQLQFWCLYFQWVLHKSSVSTILSLPNINIISKIPTMK